LRPPTRIHETAPAFTARSDDEQDALLGMKPLPSVGRHEWSVGRGRSCQ
jgi:hypothetical protein